MSMSVNGIGSVTQAYTGPTQTSAQKAEEENGADDASAHPLVTDKRWLKLNEWPDVIPDCFKECEDD